MAMPNMKLIGEFMTHLETPQAFYEFMNMNLIGVFVTKLWPVQALACGGGGRSKNIVPPPPPMFIFRGYNYIGFRHIDLQTIFVAECTQNIYTCTCIFEETNVVYKQSVINKNDSHRIPYQIISKCNGINLDSIYISSDKLIL